jgi:hypothetical protein
MQWGSLPCISDHEMCTQRVAASGLQGKDHKSPLSQTSLSPHEAEGGKQKTFSIKQPHKYLLATIPCGTMKHKLVKGIWEGGVKYKHKFVYTIHVCNRQFQSICKMQDQQKICKYR